MLATREGFKDVVSYLMNSQAVLSLRNRYGESALWLAASNGHLKIVKTLINNLHKCECTLRDFRLDYTPAEVAFINGFQDVFIHFKKYKLL